MKKIIRAISALVAIGVFILATQISCQKTTAQTSATSSPSMILYDQQITTTAAGPSDSSGHVSSVTVYSRQYYITNIDGSNPRQISISLPSGLYAQGGGRLTVDGKTLVFPVSNQSGAQQSLYSCAVDGSFLKQVLSLPGTSTFEDAK